MFGPPGCMKEAAEGKYGLSVHRNYGLFPRGVFEIVNRLQEIREKDPDNTYVLSCAAVELSIMGNEDMFDKSERIEKIDWGLGSAAAGIVLDKFNSTPPRLYGQHEEFINN